MGAPTMKIAILAALCAVASANQVHRFSVHSHSQKQLLDRFVDDHEGSEVWDSVPGSHMDVLVQDEHMVDADNLPLYRSTFIQDVNSLIELSETQQIGADASDFHTAYHSSKNIAGFLESLSKKHAHADLVQLGSTVMGQKMVGLRIGDKSKPEILLQGGQHAREWIAPGALAYAADKLLEKDSSGVLKDFSVMMIPAANPEEYGRLLAQEVCHAHGIRTGRGGRSRELLRHGLEPELGRWIQIPQGCRWRGGFQFRVFKHIP